MRVNICVYSTSWIDRLMDTINAFNEHIISEFIRHNDYKIPRSNILDVNIVNDIAYFKYFTFDYEVKCKSMLINEVV